MGGPGPPPDEAAMLNGELNWLRSENSNLQRQLYNLQQENTRLKTNPPPGPAPGIPGMPRRHNPAWSEHTNPQDGSKYYYNKETGESVWERPLDFNPGGGGGPSRGSVAKGPPGSNLFVVRKLRREEYDEFNDQDLREAFSKYGDVLRCEMSIDSGTGWSKGFGFVSYTEPGMADAAIDAMNGSWLAGKQMKVEKTKEDS